jgi:asparagine synthase (glutamine-hydrolysing)
MSGIVGFLNAGGTPADPCLVARMTAAVAHRGPDARGHWVAGPVGLGHAQFRTTPESSAERQPCGLGGRLWITADARVDNRDELIEALGLGGRARPQPPTDAELLLHAYEAWGERCVERLAGDFAFALWDEPRRRLFLARDPLGVRPLLWWSDGKVLLFASEPRPLFQHPGPACEVNWALVGDQLCGNCSAPEETLYLGVRKLPAGHAAVVEGGALRPWRYWPGDLTRQVRHPRAEGYAEEFRALLGQAVRCRLRSSTPVGIQLSGGLDSSSLACVARDVVREDAAGCAPFETLSLVYPGLPCDESEYIDAVVRELGVPSHRLPYGEAFHEAARLERAAEFPDVGFGPGSFGQVITVARCAARRGIRVLIDGFGGDELFATTPARVADSLRAGDLPGLWRRLRHARDELGMPVWRLLLRWGVWPLLPDRVKEIARRLRGRNAPATYPHKGLQWIDEGFTAQFRLRERWAAQHPGVIPEAGTHSRRVLLELLTRSYNQVHALEWNDRFTARLGVEKRHPFFDRRLVDYCLAIPDEARIADGSSKYLLREALRGVLPEAVRERRSKVWFDSIWEEEINVRQAGAVGAAFEDLRLESAGVLKKGEAGQLLGRARQGDGKAINPVCAILELELWYREFLRFRGQPHQPEERTVA